MPLNNREIEGGVNTPAFLKSLKLFYNLDEVELLHFVNRCKLKNFKKGQFVFHENEVANFFYVVCNGWLKLFHTSPEGEDMVLAMLSRGNMVSGKSLCENLNFTMSAQVVADAEILCIPLTLLKERMKLNNQLLQNILSAVIQQKYFYELQLKRYVLYSAAQRIGSFLLNLCDPQDQADGTIITLPFDKVLIASTLWMTAPTFSRALNILRDKTNIGVTGNFVTIDSIDCLLEFVGGCYTQPDLLPR